MATQLGRLTLGVGAGWSHREHEMFGFDLLAPSDRLAIAHGREAYAVCVCHR